MEAEPCCFAIIPDGHSHPAAVFASLEDAMEWALAKYGNDRFSIRQAAAADLSQPDSRFS